MEDKALENQSSSEIFNNNVPEPPFHFSEKEERRLIMKVDIKLLIILGVLYSIAMVDRTNIANANVVGMGDELGFEGTNRYSIISLIFYVPYALSEIPCNMLLRKYSPKVVLATIATLWGVATLGIGFVTDWTHIVACRVLLGIFEGGIYPGCIFLVQSWYRRDEVQKRMAGFTLISYVISGFGSIIGWGLSRLDGTHGINGWRWIFIIEGAFTIAVGILSYFIIQDFPDKETKSFTKEEIAFIRYRIEKDRGDLEPDELNLKVVLRHLSDWKIWMYAFMYFCGVTGNMAYSYFTPLILNGMGFNQMLSLLLVAPPNFFSVITGMGFAYLADKYFIRSPFITAQACMVILGLLITTYVESNIGKYIATFIGIAGGNGLIPAILAYNANNVLSSSKRAVSSGLTVSFGAIGGVYSTTTFRSQDAPNYLPGSWAVTAANIMSIVVLGFFTVYFHIQNKRSREGKLSQPLEGRPGFFYTL